MADDLARLEIQIGSSGVDTAKRRMDNMERSGRGLEKTTRRLGIAWKEIGVILSALQFARLTREMIEMGDAYKRATLLVGQFEESQSATAATMERLFRLSQKTRAEFDATVSIYQRFRVATQELGVSNEVLFAAIEGLQKSIVVAGVSAQEAQAAMIQLSQGMASGRLQGEELRSVLDGMPVVARAIAQAAGIGFGELRDAAAEGRIGVDAVLRALVTLNRTMEKDFQGAALTTDQAATRVGNALQRAVGLAEQAEGGTNKLAQALDDLAEAMTSAAFVSGIGNVMALFGWIVDAGSTGAQILSRWVDAIKALASGETARAIKLAGDNFRQAGAFFGMGEFTPEAAAAPGPVQTRNVGLPPGMIGGPSEKQVKALEEAQKMNAAIREETQAIMDGAKAWEEYKQARDISNEVDVFADDLKDAGATADQIKRLTTERRFLLEAQQEAIRAHDDERRALEFLEDTGSRTFDRIGSAITEAYTQGSAAALSFRSVAQGVVSELAQSFIKLAAINPLKNALFGTSSATLSSVAGSSLFSGLSGSLPFGGTTGQSFGDFVSYGASAHPGLRYADGGDHPGGFRLVGERGPELEATGPSRIFNANQTKEILSGGAKKEGNTINVYPDLRGASAEAVGELYRMVRDLDANIEPRAIAGVVKARQRNPKLLGGR